jgi:hypothetical protein
MRSPEEVVALCKDLALRLWKLNKQFWNIRIHPVRLSALLTHLGEIECRVSEIEDIVRRSKTKGGCKNV